MADFIRIYKVQLAAMFWNGRKNGSKSKKRFARPRSAAGTLALFLIVMLIMAVYEFFYMSLICMGAETQSASAGLAGFLVLVAAFSMLLTLMTSVSYTKTLLYEAKDYEALCSLPIRSGTVVAAKLATLYTLDLVFSLAMMLPCGVFYGIFALPALSFYFFYFTLIFFVPLIPILISALVSALICLIASRFRRMQAVTILLYILFFFGILSVSFFAGSTAGEPTALGDLFSGMLEAVLPWYPPLMWFYEAVMDGMFSSAALFAGVSMLAFSLVTLLIGKFYGRFQAIFRPAAVRRQYKATRTSSAAIVALMKKDWRRLCSSAGVFMNQLVGILMLVVFAVMFGIQSFGVTDEADLAQMTEIFSVMLPFLFAMAASMVSDTSTSISMEGKAFPLIKSLPISAKTYLYSKLALHMALCAPVIVLCGVGISIVKQFPLISAVACVVIPLCYAYSSGIVGLLINLKKYRFDWASEIMVAKNSLPVMLTIFGGMILSIVPMVVAIVLCELGIPLAAVMGFFMAISAIVSVALTAVMSHFGERLFRKIEY